MLRIKVILGIAFAAILLACKDKRPEQQKRSYGTGYVTAREPLDSASYKHVKYDFYTDKGGRLFLRKLLMGRDRDSACRCAFVVVYDPLFTHGFGDKGLEKRLDEVIDIGSFQAIDSSDFAKDNKHVYYHYGNSDGGNLSIVAGADPATFRRLADYRWGIDKEHVYFQFSLLDSLDPASTQVLRSPDTSDHFISYVRDNRFVYHENYMVQGADAKSFKAK
ncbi:DKNYY domain-containing protein [Paraflavitalea sp. CAU 1676]|uniref:DKNYY domain-containing protein n=1 Tax=Paraflavitalea sp. CAU 1676 TaxID=3032598 RepID=UPI0023DA1C4B|nr:DKNYY domain-containing protein [Paraflavitalea sp. CAU 1676]MDF2190061.1 DKNYY domain-containing protein [Paraflavitalea sp. CAU 1676]